MGFLSAIVARFDSRSATVSFLTSVALRDFFKAIIIYLTISFVKKS